MSDRLAGAAAGRIGAIRATPVADGQSGAVVHRLDGASDSYYLKAGSGAAAGLVRDEIARLRWLAGRVPAAGLVDAGDDGDTAWLLTEALPGMPAGAWLKRDPHLVGPVTTALAGFLTDLHALPVAECPFDSSVAAWLPAVRRLVADGQVDVDDFDPDHRGWSAAAVLAKVEALAHRASGAVVVHGDLSLGNVLLDADMRVTGCIDVGRLGVGDPYRDITIAWRDLAGFGADIQRMFVAALGLDALDERRVELHRALDELF